MGKQQRVALTESQRFDLKQFNKDLTRAYQGYQAELKERGLTDQREVQALMVTEGTVAALGYLIDHYRERDPSMARMLRRNIPLVREALDQLEGKAEQKPWWKRVLS